MIILVFFFQECYFSHLLQNFNHSGFVQLKCTPESFRLEELEPDEILLVTKRVFKDHIDGQSRICMLHRERLGTRFHQYYHNDCNFPYHNGGRRTEKSNLRALKNEECRFLFIKYGLFIPISSKVRNYVFHKVSNQNW